MSRRLPTAAFLLIQAVVLTGLGGGIFHSRAERDRDRALPEPRPVPIALEPRHDDPQVVSDEDLRRVLGRLTLTYSGMETSVGHVDHVFRLWGPQAEFPSEGAMSGADLQAILTDHRRFAQVYGSEAPPLLLDVEGGVRVRALEGPTSTSHVDHLLASLAELGTPLDQPIRSPAGETTYRAILEGSLRGFSLNQAEYEWSALAYALFLPPARGWTTWEGQRVTFGSLARRIMRERLPSGVCSAHHRMHALTAFLRVDEETAANGGILEPDERREILTFLRDATGLLVRHQHRRGFWNFDWPFAPPAGEEPTTVDGDRLGDRIIATGHALEWWSLAPEEVQPPRRVVVRAARWVAATVDEMSDEEVQTNISFLSHAGRALAQWRGREPAEALEPGRR